MILYIINFFSRFATERFRDRHVYTVHRSPFICDFCGKTFKSKIWLQQHVDDHNGPRETFKCEECGKSYSTKLHLKKHYNVMHVEENRKPQTCPICFKVSASLNAHKYHLNFAHKMQAKFECTFCGVKYKRRYELNVCIFIVVLRKLFKIL